MFSLQQPRHIPTLPWLCKNSPAEALTAGDLGEVGAFGHFREFG